uniref:Uncharacterized protein n=1 Tax=Octopus bimaculoides TaxID=37653 RepID=A0A0L8GC42_OCTBM
MKDGRIPKDIFYGELAAGQRNKGCPQLRYNDVCRENMKVLNIDINSWEDLAADRTSWKSALLKQLRIGEEELSAAATEKRDRRKGSTADRPESTHRWDLCDRDCHFRINLQSHRRRCSRRAAQHRQ